MRICTFGKPSPTSLSGIHSIFSPGTTSPADSMAEVRTKPCPSITEHGGSASGDDGKVLWIREATTSSIVSSLGTSSFQLLANARQASILSARYDPER